MKPRFLLLSAVASAASLFLTGCEGIYGVPYRAGTPAVRIYESHYPPKNPTEKPASPTEKPTDPTEKPVHPITVPVEAGDGDAQRYLSFSDVRVDVDERDGRKSIKVYTEMTPRQIVWRVSFIKDGKEVYHFNTFNRTDYSREALPLEPLAMDDTLPVPDKVVITRVKEHE